MEQCNGRKEKMIYIILKREPWNVKIVPLKRIGEQRLAYLQKAGYRRIGQIDTELNPVQLHYVLRN